MEIDRVKGKGKCTAKVKERLSPVQRGALFLGCVVCPKGLRLYRVGVVGGQCGVAAAARKANSRALQYSGVL